LEEAGLLYNIKPINIGRGDQLTPDFLKISPNGRMPAIVDHEPIGGGAPITIFELYHGKPAHKLTGARGKISTEVRIATRLSSADDSRSIARDAAG
jgi:hypothetical protein